MRPLQRLTGYVSLPWPQRSPSLRTAAAVAVTSLCVACSGSPPESSDTPAEAPAPTSIVASGPSAAPPVAAGDRAAPPPDPDGGALIPPPATGPAITAFDDAGAYAAKRGSSARDSKHSPSEDPAGTACLGCHDGSRRGVPAFLFAGTVYKDPAGTTPASSVEVRLRDANGRATSTYSDDDGNFFVAKPRQGSYAPPLRAGIRTAAQTKAMTNLITQGDCNACHRDGGQGRLVLP